MANRGQKLGDFPTAAKNFPGDFPSFRQPKIVGHFSLTNDRKFLPDMSNAGFFVQPNCLPGENMGGGEGSSHGILVKPMDLTINSEVTVKKKELLDEGLTHVLHWISLNRQAAGTSDLADKRPVRADFVCFRGLLTQLLAAPYEGPRSDPWEIAATKFQGTIYLNLRKTDEEVQKVVNRTSEHERFTRWGYKFEQYLFAKKPHGKPTPKEPLIEGEEFCCMFRSGLGDFSLLYGAEVDGVYDHDAALEPGNLIEVKVSREIEHSGHERTYKRFKLLKWWAQQFTVGIPRILVGWRDDHGFVKRVETLEVKSIHRMTREWWTPQTCFNFVLHFLHWVRSVVQIDDPQAVYLFRWDPPGGRPVSCSFLGRDERRRVVPDWYVAAISQQN